MKTKFAKWIIKYWNSNHSLKSIYEMINIGVLRFAFVSFKAGYKLGKNSKL